MNRAFQRALRIPNNIRNSRIRSSNLFSKVGTPTLSAFRLYSAGPAPLSLQQIEDRVLGLLKDFDKVKVEKVRFPSHIAHY
jgi:hypothetical protein